MTLGSEIVLAFVFVFAFIFLAMTIGLHHWLWRKVMPDDLGSKWEEDMAARFEQYVRRQREEAQEHYRHAREIAAQPVIQGHIKRAITFED